MRILETERLVLRRLDTAMRLGFAFERSVRLGDDDEAPRLYAAAP